MNNFRRLAPEGFDVDEKVFLELPTNGLSGDRRFSSIFGVEILTRTRPTFESGVLPTIRIRGVLGVKHLFPLSGDCGEEF